MATTTRRATESDLWAASAGGQRCELVDGQIRAMSPAGGIHGKVCGRILVRLAAHVQDAGTVFDSSTGFRLPNGNVRAPDVAFVSNDRLEGSAVPAGFIQVAPDLAVEVQSPTDNARELLDKVGEYLLAGTRLVWVVDPVARTVTAYRSPTDVRAVESDDVLDGGEVLPGFRCQVSELF